MKKFFSDFKKFITRGNVFDLAVGMIIATAFNKIVSSLVNDIIMPPIGWLIGGVNFKDLKIELPINPLMVVEEGAEVAPVTINYGNFLQTSLDFLIIAFCIFLMVKGITKLTKKKEEEKPVAPAPAPEPEPSAEEKLLTEIRDLLKNKQ